MGGATDWSFGKVEEAVSLSLWILVNDYKYPPFVFCKQNVSEINLPYLKVMKNDMGSSYLCKHKSTNPFSNNTIVQYVTGPYLNSQKLCNISSYYIPNVNIEEMNAVRSAVLYHTLFSVSESF